MTAPRQMQLSAPTHLIRELTAAAMDLTGQLWKPPAPVRALTVTAIHLVRSEDAYEQVDLFTAGRRPKKKNRKSWRRLWTASVESSGPTSSPTARPVQRKRRIPCHDNRRGKTAAPGYDPRLSAQLPFRYREAADRAIARHLLALPEYRSAGAVFCFVSAGREIDTRPILEQTLADGKMLCVPLCVADGIMELRAIRDLKELFPRRLRHSGASGRQPCPLPGPDRPGGDPLCHLAAGRAAGWGGAAAITTASWPTTGARRFCCAGSGAAPGDPLRRPRLSHPLGADRSRTF